ncbi:DNA polymerase III subunit epsilon [Bradyrhizobium sp. CCBAU 53415]|nr:DNA polymerase III subunit epsilon [Bradyrhizobium sp. CCBAU 53415]
MEAAAALLEASGRYRILRRLEPRSLYDEPDGSTAHRGIFLDVETTGLDPTVDEILELAMVPFDFAADGRVFAVHESFDRLRDPGRPVPREVTALTGITDAMLTGASIDPVEVESFVADAELVVAHNAGFDRRFAERFCGAFRHLPWACSWREIPWADEGFDGVRLGQLAAGFGFFHNGHRAADDCRAGIDLLARKLPVSGRRALDVLIESSRTPRWRIRAVGAPYAFRETLKRRGYRWDAGGDGGIKAWFIDVREDAIGDERSFLMREIYRRDVDIDARRIDAYDRYSDRD